MPGPGLQMDNSIPPSVGANVSTLAGGFNYPNVKGNVHYLAPTLGLLAIEV